MFKEIKKILKGLRVAYLLLFKYNFVKVGKNFYCGKNLSIRPGTVSVGNDVFIGSYANFAVSELHIDDYVMFGPRVGIVGGDHRFDVVGIPSRATGRAEEKSVIIEKDVWVGFGSIILHGVTIGEGSIIGAGSLVTKDVPPYSIYAGSPARFIRNRFNSKEDSYSHSKAIGGTFYQKPSE